jgi:hypothetical protein
MGMAVKLLGKHPFHERPFVSQQPPRFTPDTQLNWLVRYLPLERHLEDAGASLLEVGAGHRGAGCVLKRPFVGVEVAFSQPPAAPMFPIQYDGQRLPFKTGAFHTVLSTDTLEHVPPPQRGAFLAELTRVAAQRVIVVFPADHGDEVDRCLQEVYRSTGLPQPDWLFEHMEHGMPSSMAVEATLSGFDGWRLEALPAVGDLVNILMVLGDVMPGLRGWKEQLLASAGHEFGNWLGQATFGPASRKAYLLERTSASAPLVNLDAPDTLVAALACPDCGGDFEQQAAGPTCLACGRRLTSDARGVWMMNPLAPPDAAIGPAETTRFVLSPDWLGEPDWIVPIHNFLRAFTAEDPVALYLRLNALSEGEVVHLLNPILAPFGDRPFASLVLWNPDVEALPHEGTVVLPDGDAVRCWSPERFYAQHARAEARRVAASGPSS